MSNGICIFSLTDPGQQLAQRLKDVLPNAEHLHKPQAFKETVKARFDNGNKLIFIAATGLVVRILAPLLKDKRLDPAVLVLDERGDYVIPLLSGHEGGANAWAYRIAQQLGCRCVITSANFYLHAIDVLGIGCEKNCSAKILNDIVNHVRTKHPFLQLQAIASIEAKKDEPGLCELARILMLDTVFYSGSQLHKYQGQLTEKSDFVYKLFGCYGIAEAAALAHAEKIGNNHANLIIPKLKYRCATLAVARVYPRGLK